MQIVTLDKSWLTPSDRVTRCFTPVVIVLCTKLDAECDRQATVVGRPLTFGDDRRAVAIFLLAWERLSRKLRDASLVYQKTIYIHFIYTVFPWLFNQSHQIWSEYCEIVNDEHLFSISHRPYSFLLRTLWKILPKIAVFAFVNNWRGTLKTKTKRTLVRTIVWHIQLPQSPLAISATVKFSFFWLLKKLGDHFQKAKTCL